MFANRKCEELSYPQNPKMCNTILVTPLKMQPHYSQSSRENATPSSGTSPLASYKEACISTKHGIIFEIIIKNQTKNKENRLHVKLSQNLTSH